MSKLLIKLGLIAAFSVVLIKDGFSQSIKKEDIQQILATNKISETLLKTKSFKVIYSGPRKLGGFITKLQNSKTNEILFVYEDNDGNFQSLNYYLPNKDEYLKFYERLLQSKIKAFKNGRTEEQGKYYYQISISSTQKQ